MQNKVKAGRPKNSLKAGVDFFPFYPEYTRIPKVKNLLIKFKAEGYAFLFRLWECLSEQRDFRYAMESEGLDNTPLLADFTMLEEEKFLEILQFAIRLKIFRIEDGYLSSDDLIAYLKPLLNKREYSRSCYSEKKTETEYSVSENIFSAPRGEERRAEDRIAENSRAEYKISPEKILEKIPPAIILQLNKSGVCEDLIAQAGYEYFKKEGKFYCGEKDKRNYFKAFCLKVLERENKILDNGRLAKLLSDEILTAENEKPDDSADLSYSFTPLENNEINEKAEEEIFYSEIMKHYNLSREELNAIRENFHEMYSKDFIPSKSNDDFMFDRMNFDELCEKYSSEMKKINQTKSERKV